MGHSDRYLGTLFSDKPTVFVLIMRQTWIDLVRLWFWRMVGLMQLQQGSVMSGMLHLRWAILNIVSGNAHQTQAIVDLDAVPILLKILKESASEDVQDQAARCRWVQMLDWGEKPIQLVNDMLPRFFQYTSASALSPQASLPIAIYGLIPEHFFHSRPIDPLISYSLMIFTGARMCPVFICFSAIKPRQFGQLATLPGIRCRTGTCALQTRGCLRFFRCWSGKMGCISCHF